MMFEESKTSSREDTTSIVRRDSFYNSLILSAEEQMEMEIASCSTFSRNVGFIQGLVGEAAINMVRTAAVLREEPKPRILKALVQAKVENLGKNVGTLTSTIYTNTSTLCCERAKEGANLLGISQHGHGKNPNQHGFGHRNEEQGGRGGVKRLGSTQHGYGIRQSREKGGSKGLSHTVHGYGMNHASIEKGGSKRPGRSMHGVQHQRQEWEKAQAKAKAKLNHRRSIGHSKR